MVLPTSYWATITIEPLTNQLMPIVIAFKKA
jgi:hypothetical protein